MALYLTRGSAGTTQEVLKGKAAVQLLWIEIARLEVREAIAENREILYEDEVDRLNKLVHNLNRIDILMLKDKIKEAEGTLAVDEARHKRTLKIAERDAIQRIEDDARAQETRFCNEMLELQEKIKKHKAKVLCYEHRIALLERRVEQNQALDRCANQQWAA